MLSVFPSFFTRYTKAAAPTPIAARKAPTAPKTKLPTAPKKKLAETSTVKAPARPKTTVRDSVEAAKAQIKAQNG